MGVYDIKTGQKIDQAAKVERCPKHKAFEIDNCPFCGTSAVIPTTI